MSLFLGLLAGGLLGSYWTRPGGWLGGMHGYYPAYWYPGYAPYGYYPTYFPRAQQPYYWPNLQPAYYSPVYARGYWYW